MAPQQPLSGNSPTSKPKLGPYKPTLILHGGAGHITRSTLPPALYAQYHASLLSYVTSTKALLDSGDTAVSAVCHAVSLMEDDPLFNCGRGSVFTTAGEIEMEASLAVTSIHDGTDGVGPEYEGHIKRSAAVSMVRRTRHPILLAREVLRMADEDEGLGGTDTMHGHLNGSHVEAWGWKRGLERKGKDWFWTKRRWDEHRRGLGKKVSDKDVCSEVLWELDDDDGKDSFIDHEFRIPDDDTVLPSQGTVGAVCMDSWGTIAVATSTGGLTNKSPGRIGDTPTVGAGFWAETWNEQRNEKKKTRTTGHSHSDSTVSPSTDTQSISEKLGAAVRAELDLWLGTCLTSPVPERSETNPNHHQYSSSTSSRFPHRQQTVTTSEKRPLMNHHPEPLIYPTSNPTRRVAIAMSGTGNGDSFLRETACRTAAAISRFSSVSLEDAVHAVAGPDGVLQRSAGDRWGKTGQGEGGIIGVEMVIDEEGRGEGRAVFDFNCGGLWRAYLETDEEGKEKPRVMVFREEY